MPVKKQGEYCSFFFLFVFFVCVFMIKMMMIREKKKNRYEPEFCLRVILEGDAI